MNLRLKYIPLLFASFGFSNISYAQTRFSDSSEIVMTAAELESFLANIANRKREQMAKRKAELNVDQLINEKLALNTNVQSTNIDDERLYRELDRINNRIDMLMMNMGNARTNTTSTYSATTPAYVPPTNTYVPPANNYVPPANTSFYQQERPATIVKPPVAPPTVYNNTSPTPVVVNTNDAEARRMQGQINALSEELRVISQLSSTTKSTDYDEEIVALNARINELKEEVAKKNTTTIEKERTIVEVNTNDPLVKGLKDYNSKIFFANNSTNLSQMDIITLAQLAEIVKQNDPRITVVVRGFASKSGSAQYNNTLSFNRAEAVKKTLMSYGLSSKHILTMHHGIDNTTNAQEARRVEVSLLVH